jgi:hypothetical protein
MCAQALIGCPARSGSMPLAVSRRMRSLRKCIVICITPTFTSVAVERGGDLRERIS